MRKVSVIENFSNSHRVKQQSFKTNTVIFMFLFLSVMPPAGQLVLNCKN